MTRYVNTDKASPVAEIRDGDGGVEIVFRGGREKAEAALGNVQKILYAVPKDIMRLLRQYSDSGQADDTWLERMGISGEHHADARETVGLLQQMLAVTEGDRQKNPGKTDAQLIENKLQFLERLISGVLGNTPDTEQTVASEFRVELGTDKAGKSVCHITGTTGQEHTAQEILGLLAKEDFLSVDAFREEEAYRGIC